MRNILIVDLSVYRDSISKIFTESGYRVDICESAYEAISKMKSCDYDLIISEVELPGDNAFDLYEYILNNYPYIPTIMTTDKNIDTFFDTIFSKGIGNVLCKPVKKDEIIRLAEKLITKKNIFGLSNYIKDIIETKKISITNSKQIKNAISAIIQEIKSWGFDIENRISLSLVLNEMAINAVYHSYGFSHEKKQRVAVKLPEGECVDLFFGRSKDKYGIAIDDYNGRLSKGTILESINRVIEQSNLIDQAVLNGKDISHHISETGRGIDLVRKLAGEYYFIIKENERTEIMLIFDRGFDDDDSTNYSSLKIIEDLEQR